MKVTELSYCKKVIGSSVYLYKSTEGYICHECYLNSGNHTIKPDVNSFLNHLKEHVLKGHAVPYIAIGRIWIESVTNEKQ